MCVCVFLSEAFDPTANFFTHFRKGCSKVTIRVLSAFVVHKCVVRPFICEEAQFQSLPMPENELSPNQKPEDTLVHYRSSILLTFLQFLCLEFGLT